MVIQMKFKNIRVSLKNIKKRRGAACTLALLIMLAATFLFTGINIMNDANQLFNRNVEELEEADNAYVMSKKVYKPEYVTFLENDERVSALETQGAVSMDITKLKLSDGDIQVGAAFLNMEESTGFQKMHIAEQMQGNLPKNAVFVPIVFKEYGFKQGDSVTLEYKNTYYTFTIAGFVNTTSFSITSMGTFKYYLTPSVYHDIADEIGEGIIVSIKCVDHADTKAIDTDLREYMRQLADSVSGFQMYSAYNYSEAEAAYNYMGEMLAIVLMCFAFLIVIITALIIRFRILNNMEENMIQIGTLEALGFTTVELQRIYAYEYIITSIAGTILGCVLSYVVLPITGKIIGRMNGLTWYTTFHFVTNLLGGALLIAFVVAICYLSAGRIRKISPVSALAKGMESHSNKHDFFPLEHAKGNMQIVLAAKEFFGFIRQNITVMVCIMGVTFALLCGIYMYVAFGYDLTTVKKISGWEWVDVQIEANETADVNEMKSTIEKLNGVRKVCLAGEMKQNFADGTIVYATPYENFAELETLNAFEGRMPQYENEVLVTKSWADRNGKQIGDTISVEYNGFSAEYLVTGYNQSFSNNGNMIEMTGDGYRRINPYGKLNTIDIYLEEGYSPDAVIDEIKSIYGASQEDMAESVNNDALTEDEKIIRAANEKIARLMKSYGVTSVDYSIMLNGKIISGSSRQFDIETMIDFNKTFGSQLKSVESAFAGMTLLLLVSSVLIICLMLVIIIRALISKSRTRFGIMKAMGYSTGQLMQQIAFSIMPSAVLGTLAGIILNSLTGNHIATLAMSGMGISKVEFMISPLVSIMTGAGVLLYTFVIAMLYASRVRKISVYELLMD